MIGSTGTSDKKLLISLNCLNETRKKSQEMWMKNHVLELCLKPLSSYTLIDNYNNN